MTSTAFYNEGSYGPVYDSEGDGHGCGYGHTFGGGYGNGDDNSSGSGGGRLRVFVFEGERGQMYEALICHDRTSLLSVLINQQVEFTTHRGQHG